MLVTRHTAPLISECLNALKTILQQNNKNIVIKNLTNSCNVAFDTNDRYILQ